MDGQIDFGSIGFEDLQEEYSKLRERYNQLVLISEEDTQRIHELRRSLETAAAAEAYLSQELEQLSSAQSSQNDVALLKKQNEVDELKKRQNALLAENEELHQDVADLRAENTTLKHKLKELAEAAHSVEISYQIPKDHLELKQRLEAENLELLAKLDESHESVVSFTMKLAEKEKQIEMLNDQVLCLEENLQSKREEVEEKSQMLESAQEQIVEMNGKIAMLTSAPDDANRKGNSLFAEVDDQRQAMKQLLAAQKKNYLHMKKVFNESQHEIRRLKRENAAMHNELQACTTIFCSADKTYKEKLNERIMQLIKQNEDLENKLSFTQQELVTLANDKGVAWLDSMLLFCKQETEELKKQLHSNRLQKGILEERLRNSQQDLAKWRFEALKSRCILIDREALLTDNKIEFKTFTNRDVSFPPSVLESVTPNIGVDIQQIRQKKNNAKDQISPNRIVKVEDTPRETSKLAQAENDVKSSPEICQIKKEVDNSIVNTPEEASCLPKKMPIRAEVSNPTKPLEADFNSLHIKTEPRLEENKENVPNLCAKPQTSTQDELKPRPSILVAKKDIFSGENTTKSVHFAQTERTDQRPKFTCKSTRTKSNFIVRRIIIKSKREKTESEDPPVPQ